MSVVLGQRCALPVLLLLASCTQHVSPTETTAETTAPEAETWVLWRPCGCAEGCAAIHETPGELREGMVVRIDHGNVRAEARPIPEGTMALVEAALGADGAPVLVLTHAGERQADGTYGPVVCSYLCTPDHAGPVERSTCEGGEPPGATSGGETETAAPAPRGPPIRVSDEALTALRACDRHAEPMTARFGDCVCETLCRVNAPIPPPSEGTVRIRYPFFDVDGLAFTEHPDGHVSDCSYDAPGGVHSARECRPSDPPR